MFMRLDSKCAHQVRPPLPVRQVRRRPAHARGPLSAGAHRVPTFIFSAWPQQSTLVPVRWAVEDAMTWRGIGLSGAVVSALVLIGFAAAFSFIAVSRFGGKGLTKS
jgi:hypothetical protein